jgi:hypothetical protein
MTDRLRPSGAVLPALLAGLLLGALLGACATGSGATPSASSPATPTLTPVPEASVTPLPTRIGSPADAAAVALATDPRLAGIGPLDPGVIGASAWWEVRRLDMGDWIVTVTVGWGDCQAGCIERHVWTFRVTPDAAVTLESESGPPLPSVLPD